MTHLFIKQNKTKTIGKNPFGLIKLNYLPCNLQESHQLSLLLKRRVSNFIASYSTDPATAWLSSGLCCRPGVIPRDSVVAVISVLEGISYLIHTTNWNIFLDTVLTFQALRPNKIYSMLFFVSSYGWVSHKGIWVAAQICQWVTGLGACPRPL